MRMSGSLSVVAFEGELNAIVREYLDFGGFDKTLQNFEKEISSKGKPLSTKEAKGPISQKQLAAQFYILFACTIVQFVPTIVSDGEIKATLTLAPLKDSCYNVVENVTLVAVYNGTNTLSQIKWYRSGSKEKEFGIGVSKCEPVEYQTVYVNMIFRCPSNDPLLPENEFHLTLLTDDEPTQSWGVSVTFTNSPQAELPPKPLLSKCISHETGVNKSNALVYVIVTVSVILPIGILAMVMCIKQKKKSDFLKVPQVNV